MSGDVQPRKRKDKKKRKEDDGYSPLNDDVNIHVHKEGGTGGNICAKIVFFILFSALIVLIGLIIKENQGLTELEDIEQESRYSQIFEGWVDNHPDAHGDNHDDKLSEEHYDHDLEEDDHDQYEDEESINETEEQSEEANQDEDQEDEEDQDEEDQEDEEDSTVSSEEEKLTVKSEEDDSTLRSREDSTVESEEEDSTIRSGEETEEDEQLIESEEDTQTESNEDDVKTEEEEGHSKSQETDMKENIINKSQEKKKNFINLNNKDNSDAGDDDDNNNDDDDDATETEKSDEENREITKDDDSSKDNKSEELDEDPKATDVKEDNEQVKHEEAPAEETAEEISNKSSGAATKIGVGVALLAVAYNFFFRKRSPDNPVKPLSSNSSENQITPDLSRRNTIVPPLTLQEVEADLPEIEAEEEEYSEEDYSDEDSKSDHRSTREDYQELRSTYARSLATGGNFDIKNENLQDVNLQHDDDIEEEEIDEQLNEEEIEDVYEQYDEEEDDEDEELLKRLEAKYGKLGRDVNVGKELASDSGKEDDKDDYNINVDIEAAEKQLPKNAAYANKLFDALLNKHSLSPRILYGKAQALDLLAEEKQSNELLQQAIAYYMRAINVPNIPNSLFVTAGERYINRTRFLGQYMKAIAAHWQLIERFLDNPTYLNNLAVTYLTINLIEDARSVLKKVLEKWPNNGFALVHYGFILKTADNNLNESVDFIAKGLRTKEPGVTDGKFYYHLGDALTRLNRNEEAAKFYEEGVKEKVFISKYQRSLYNAPRLNAKPWWEPSDIPAYQKLFLALKNNWQAIRKEGLAAITEEEYFRDEAENLKDTGTWKQLELFARGLKFTKNCAKNPITCGIIEQFPEARSCRRGQTKFSIMHPATHVWPHVGPTNCRLRIHLGLKVPNDTFIRVAEETRSWIEGEIIIFDDSFEHEVWHNGSEFRLVLIVDVWHPELTSSDRKSLSSI